MQDIDAIYRSDSRRVLATLIRLLGDFELAEEAMQDAFSAAVERWPAEGTPKNPYAWLVSTGRFKAIDQLRRRATFDASVGTILEQLGDGVTHPDEPSDDLEDDRLRLIFTCCHPALAPDAQIALTLREVCGLTTEEIARAYFTTAPTVAQRIVRAKTKIRDARIPYEVPSRADIAQRLDAVLRVVYLVFNEGYSATAGDSVTRADLAAEALRLGRLIVELLPEAEAIGLLALMLLQDSRRSTRMTASGELVLLSEQDRSRWDRRQIDEGVALVDRALSSSDAGPYSLQAAIAAQHASALTADATNWKRIVRLYDALAELDASAVVALNRAAALAMAEGPEPGLSTIDALLASGELNDYSFAHSARGELLRRLNRHGEAVTAYRRALDLSSQEPERQFLKRRIAACDQR
jgi:RNA polymerase sigma-70 factor (ECF subfamily)